MKRREQEMSKRRNKQQDDEEMDESWLLPYADILTLLLALFIVLYSMSSVDAKKFEELSQAFNSVFVGDKGILENDEAVPPEIPDEDIPPIPKKEEGAGGETEDELDEDQLGLEQKAEVEELEKIQGRVDEYILDKALSNRFETSLTKQGLLITIRDNVLFDSGSADVREENYKTATELSELLTMDPPREVVINGHTDDIPISTASYSSNWELSVSRSVNFMKLILKNEALDPQLFSAKGSGEFQPIASNETAEGRTENRRVEILVLPLINMDTEQDD